MITREKFIERVGIEPENDDLDRCNCLKAGFGGHRQCGWSKKYDLPNFMLSYELVKEERESE